MPTWYKRMKSTDRDVGLLFHRRSLEPVSLNPDVLVVGRRADQQPVDAFTLRCSANRSSGGRSASCGAKHSRWGGCFCAFIERRATAFLGYSSVAVDYFSARAMSGALQPGKRGRYEQSAGRNRRHARQVEPLRDQLGLRGKRVVLYVGGCSRRKNSID
jgi:hypothetical protein